MPIDAGGGAALEGDVEVTGEAAAAAGAACVEAEDEEVGALAGYCGGG